MPVCSFEGCGRNVIARGYCSAHYQQLLSGKDLIPHRSDKIPDPCIFPGCDEPEDSKGYCRAHYRQHWRGEEVRAYWPRSIRRECAFDGCKSRGTDLGYCKRHRKQLLDGEELHEIDHVFKGEERDALWNSISISPECQLDGCENPRNAMKPYRNSAGMYLCKIHVSHFTTMGVDLKDYLWLMSIKECQVCHEAGKRMVTDHDHPCKRHGKKKMCGECIRGRLCHGCNSALGLMGEDRDKLIALSAYAAKAKRAKEENDG